MTTQLKDVFVISDGETKDKRYSTRIGVAFVNRDGSLNVVLDAVPISGRLYIRDRKLKTTEGTK